MFPNPIKSVINISSKFPVDRVELYDVYGKLLLNIKENTNTINVDNLNSGIYLLGIYSDSKKIIKKVVIN